MAGLDTNALVRWLVDDDPQQSDQVEALFRSVTARQERLFVPCTVLLELEWVLRSRYGFDKRAILQTINALLEVRELQIQSEAAVERALHAYRQAPAEFADCLHAGLCSAEGHAPMFTFDAKAARLDDVELLDG
ncbi:MAG: type II toxin-antitoxin system VapC family toxin [Nevskia sp.]|nr:type II toxin-antitoxin system VapC family toxin [Nevskia sp.]